MWTSFSGSARLASSSQNFMDSPIEPALGLPAMVHCMSYGADPSVSLSMNDSLQMRGQGFLEETYGGQNSLKEKYLMLGEKLGIPDLSVPAFPSAELAGIGETRRTWPMSSLPEENLPWEASLGTTIEGGADASAGVLLDPEELGVFEPLARAEAIGRPSDENQRFNRQKTDALPLGLSEGFFNGLDFSKLPPLPNAFNVDRKQYAAKNIFAAVPKNVEEESGLSAAASNFIKNLRSIEKDKNFTDETWQIYQDKAYRFIRYIEDSGVMFNKGYVSLNFESIKTAYNKICEKFSYREKYYRLPRSFRKFFFGLMKKRPLLEIEESLSATHKKMISDYRNYLFSITRSEKHIKRCVRSLIRFASFMAEKNLGPLSNVHEGNANELYWQCWNARGFRISRKSFIENKPENPVQDVEWLKHFLKFIQQNSSQERTSADRASAPYQAPLITLSSDDEKETDSQEKIDSNLLAELCDSIFFDESPAEFQYGRQAPIPQQKSTQNSELIADTVSISEFLNMNDDDAAFLSK